MSALPCLIPEQTPGVIFKAFSFDCPTTSRPLRAFMVNGELWLAEQDLPDQTFAQIREAFPAFMRGWNSASVVHENQTLRIVSQHIASFIQRLPQPAMRAFAFWLDEFVLPEVRNYRLEHAA